MFPLDLWDISLLIAIITAILLVSSELLLSHYGKVNILIDKGKLKTAAIGATVAFLITVAAQVIIIITS